MSKKMTRQEAAQMGVNKSRAIQIASGKINPNSLRELLAAYQIVRDEKLFRVAGGSAGRTVYTLTKEGLL